MKKKFNFMQGYLTIENKNELKPLPKSEKEGHLSPGRSLNKVIKITEKTEISESENSTIMTEEH